MINYDCGVTALKVRPITRLTEIFMNDAFMRDKTIEENYALQSYTGLKLPYEERGRIEAYKIDSRLTKWTIIDNSHDDLIIKGSVTLHSNTSSISFYSATHIYICLVYVKDDEDYHSELKVIENKNTISITEYHNEYTYHDSKDIYIVLSDDVHDIKIYNEDLDLICAYKTFMNIKRIIQSDQGITYIDSEDRICYSPDVFKELSKNNKYISLSIVEETTGECKDIKCNDDNSNNSDDDSDYHCS